MHHDDQKVVAFGKHKGLTFSQVAAQEPKYCEWVMLQDSPSGPMQQLAQYLRDTGSSSSAQGNAPCAKTSASSYSDSRSNAIFTTKGICSSRNTASAPSHANDFANELQFSSGWTSSGASSRMNENANPNTDMRHPPNDTWQNSFGQSATPSFSSTQAPKYTGQQASKFEQWRQQQGTGPAQQALPAPRYPGQPIFSVECAAQPQFAGNGAPCMEQPSTNQQGWPGQPQIFGGMQTSGGGSAGGACDDARSRNAGVGVFGANNCGNNLNPAGGLQQTNGEWGGRNQQPNQQHKQCHGLRNYNFNENHCTQIPQQSHQMTRQDSGNEHHHQQRPLDQQNQHIHQNGQRNQHPQHNDQPNQHQQQNGQQFGYLPQQSLQQNQYPQHNDQQNQYPQHNDQQNQHLQQNGQQFGYLPQQSLQQNQHIHQNGQQNQYQQHNDQPNQHLQQQFGHQPQHNDQPNQHLQQNGQQNQCQQQQLFQQNQHMQQNGQQNQYPQHNDQQNHHIHQNGQDIQHQQQHFGQPNQHMQQNGHQNQWGQQPTQSNQNMQQNQHHEWVQNNQPRNGQQSSYRPAVSFDQFAFKPHNSTNSGPTNLPPCPPQQHIRTSQGPSTFQPFQPMSQAPQASAPSHGQHNPQVAQPATFDAPPVPQAAAQKDFRDFKLSIEPYETGTFKVSCTKKLPMELTQLVAQLPHARKDIRAFLFPVSEYHNVVNFLSKSTEFVVDIEEAPRWVMRCIPEYQNQVPKLKKKCAVLDKDGIAELPGVEQDLADKRSYGEDKALMPYQIEGILFGIRNGGRVLIGDEMGLGKTVQALCLASCYMQEWPCLVVVPSSVRFMWRDEALEWVNIVPEEIVVVKTGKQQMKLTTRLVIVSYDMIVRNEALRVRPDGQPYGVVVLDECHYIKNRESQRTQFATTIVQNARRAVLLSGTPSLNQAAELFTQFRALIPEICPSFSAYADRFCEKVEVCFGGKGRAQTQFRGSKRMAELNVMLTNTIMIRRRKDEVLTQLPKKRRQKVKLEVKATDLKELKAMMASNGIHDDTQDLAECAPESAGSVNELFQATTKAKMPAVHEYVEYLVNVGCKFIVFAHHHFCIDEIESKVQGLKVDYIRIDGRITGEARENKVRKFNEGGLSVQVAILSILACGQGLNLQSCSTVVFAELYWVPGLLIQAEDRVHRLGQQANSVNIHYLVVPETIDDIMYNILCRKHKDLSAMLDGEERTLGAANVSSMGAVEVQTGQQTESGRVNSRQSAAASKPGGAASAYDIIKVDSEGEAVEKVPTRRKKKAPAASEPDSKQRRIDTFFKRKPVKNHASSVAQFDSNNFF